MRIPHSDLAILCEVYRQALDAGREPSSPLEAVADELDDVSPEQHAAEGRWATRRGGHFRRREEYLQLPALEAVRQNATWMSDRNCFVAASEAAGFAWDSTLDEALAAIGEELE